MSDSNEEDAPSGQSQTRLDPQRALIEGIRSSSCCPLHTYICYCCYLSISYCCPSSFFNRKSEFGVGVELNAEGQRLMQVHQDRLGRSLDRLSTELYSKDTHFVLELIQVASSLTVPLKMILNLTFQLFIFIFKTLAPLQTKDVFAVIELKRTEVLPKFFQRLSKSCKRKNPLTIFFAGNTSAKEVMFFFCLFCCLFICQQHNSKFSREAGNWPRNNLFHFGEDPSGSRNVS